MNTQNGNSQTVVVITKSQLLDYLYQNQLNYFSAHIILQYVEQQTYVPLYSLKCPQQQKQQLAHLGHCGDSASPAA